MGQSVTLSGRQIVKHMLAQTNEIVSGPYAHDGDAVIYSDTDSIYFTPFNSLKKAIDNNEITWNKETAIELIDAISDQVNPTFPGFMEKAFHCPYENGKIIQAGREIVADRGLFITKKRYALNIIDKEGKRKDLSNMPGEVKAMGLDLKRADTPKYIQEFLMDILKMVLAGTDKELVISSIRSFKAGLTDNEPWTKGSPKAVNNLTKYGKLLEDGKKGMIPGHVRAALNYNKLRTMNSDTFSQQIVDGSKIVVCKLKNNPMGFSSVAYPVDELRLPQWFKELPFDAKLMETKIVDEKINNLIGVLEWGVKEHLDTDSTFGNLFDFG